MDLINRGAKAKAKAVMYQDRFKSTGNAKYKVKAARFYRKSDLCEKALTKTQFKRTNNSLNVNTTKNINKNILSNNRTSIRAQRRLEK